MGKNRRIIIPPEATQDFKYLISLPTDTLNKLSQVLNEIPSLSLPLSELWKISKTLQIPNEKVIDIFYIIKFLLAQKESFDIEDNDFINELFLFSKEIQDKEIQKYLEEKRNFIPQIFRYREKYEQFEKRRFLETGPLKTAFEFRSICDLRPVYAKDKESIEEMRPIVIMRIRTRDDLERTEELVFQLREESIKELEDFINTLKRKLDKLKEEYINKKKPD